MRTVLDSHLNITQPDKRIREHVAGIQLPNKKYDNELTYMGWTQEKPFKDFYEVFFDEGTNVPRYVLPRNILTDIPIDEDNRVSGYPILFPFLGELREYQQRVVDGYISNPQDGYIIMPCGSGKTYTGINLIHRVGQKTVVLVHTEEILKQWVSGITNLLGEAPGVYYGKKKTLRNNRVVVAMIQSLVRGIPERMKKAGFLVADECFPAGTKVDGKNIEDIQVGDYVLSYNHQKQLVEKKKVLYKFKKEVVNSSLVDVVLQGGKKLSCTYNHPVWNGSDYQQAFMLNYGNMVYSIIHADEEKQSDVFSEESRKNERYSQGYGVETQNTGWKWETFTNAPNLTSGETRLGYGSGCFNKICKEFIRGWLKVSELLQNRYSKSKIESGSRSKRREPQFEETSITGSQEAFLFKPIRVEGVVPYQSGDIRGLGGLCKKSVVYNLEVEDNKNYFADNILVHNCHHAPCDSWLKVLNSFGAKYRLGLTATPRRKDGLEKLMFYHMGNILTTVTHKELEKYGVIKIPEIVFIDSGLKLPIPTKRGGKMDYAKLISNLLNSDCRNELIRNIIMVLYLVKNHILVLSDRREHLERLYEELDGLDRAIFYGGLTSAEREEALRSKIILGTSAIAKEGLDIKTLDALVLTSPLDDPEQPVGRIARDLAGKKPVCIAITDNQMPIFRDKYEKAVEILVGIGCDLSYARREDIVINGSLNTEMFEEV